MADLNLFPEETKVDEQPNQDQVQTIKVGEKEYSQDELNRLVNLGEIGVEAEEKYGVKIDKIWPNHQRTINEKMQIEQELTALKQTPATPQTAEQQTDDQIAQQAREQLSKLGYVSKNEVQDLVSNIIAGNRLLDETRAMLVEMEEAGYPKADETAVLQHMAENGYKNPTKAYKDLFEADIEKIKEQKLASLKPSSFVTSDGSTAGSKAPAPQKIDSKNLRSALEAILTE